MLTTEYFSMEGGGYIPYTGLNGTEVTQEQYQEAIYALVGTGEFQSCTSTQYTSVLEMLENIIRWGL